MLTIREITENDADSFLEMCRALDSETSFMMLEPDERTLSVDEQRERIHSLAGRNNAALLVAELDGQLVGYIFAEGGSYRRNRHCAHIVIGIRAAFTGLGIGRRLFAELFTWAGNQGLTRLELTVMTHNERAVRLYQRMGFEIEGLRRRSLFVNGEYVDEYLMSKLIFPGYED